MAVRTNTDGVDSLVLARYGALVNPRRGTPPPVEACILRDVLARREAIKQDVQREHHRQEKTNMTQRSDLIQQSLTDSMAFHTGQLKKIQSHIDDPIDRHPALKNDLDVLHSIPAIGPQRGTQRLAVMHSHPYPSAEQWAAYWGDVSLEHQSGRSVMGRAQLSKAGPSRLRAVLYRAAVVAIRHTPYIKAMYERLRARGTTKMSALGAAIRTLVHVCFGVLKNQQKYQADYKNAWPARRYLL